MNDSIIGVITGSVYEQDEQDDNCTVSSCHNHTEYLIHFYIIFTFVIVVVGLELWSVLLPR